MTQYVVCYSNQALLFFSKLIAITGIIIRPFAVFFVRAITRICFAEKKGTVVDDSRRRAGTGRCADAKKEIRYIGPLSRANANNSRCGRDVKG
jgi:hypothetical protein